MEIVSSPSSAPLPVTIISGYLGAGKTTLVNAMLSGGHGLRIVVLVNDFGEVPIDERLIAGRSADVIALANGCMCCQIGGDLYDAIDRILRMRDAFDHLVIETSGVADPEKIAQIAVAEPELDMSRTVVLVDTVNFADVLADARLADTLMRQVRAADLILLTKTDKASGAIDDIQMTVAAAATRAPVVTLPKGSEDAYLLLTERPTTLNQPSRALPIGFHSLPFDSWSWRGNIRVDRDSLMAFAANPAFNIYRLKGRVLVKGGHPIILHKVGSEIAVEEAAETFETSELVAIGTGPGFDRLQLQAAWDALIRL